MKNLEEIRARLKQMEEGRPKSRKWKPKDAEGHSVRCLPLPGEEDLALLVKWHYKVDNGRAMACPSTWGDECAICDFANFLRSWKDADGNDKPDAVRKRDWNLFRDIGAADKHYVPVIVRKAGAQNPDEHEGPFLWEMTPKTYQSLLAICANDDWNEDHPEGGALRVLTSLTTGLDLIVSLKKANTPGNQTTFDLTKVEERKKFSKTLKNPADAEALLKKIPTLEDVAKRVTSEEAEKVFASWHAAMSSRPEQPDTDGGLEHATNGGETPASGGASVDETVSRLEALLKKQPQQNG